ncbi:MAG: universal stress protein [Desulfosarcinaceae bacterium]|nr:universal stress protein [Desulfosarcinaceae bacterium]
MAKQFLVGYTGSPESRAALKLAIVEARLYDAKLFVINSQEGGSAEKPGELAETQAALQSARDLMADTDIAYEVSESVRGLSPGEDLVRFAADNQIDRIFVGVEKKSRTRKLILGSTAQYIILKAACPVVTAK